jgi:hydrogenase maturation factor
MSKTRTPFEARLAPPELSKGEREYQAFLRLLPQLLGTHQGKYVAVHEGQVIDSDTDDIALIQRVHARIGYVPIHVGLVTEQPLVVRVPHYREYRPRGGE